MSRRYDGNHREPPIPSSGVFSIRSPFALFIFMHPLLTRQCQSWTMAAVAMRAASAATAAAFSQKGITRRSLSATKRRTNAMETASQFPFDVLEFLNEKRVGWNEVTELSKIVPLPNRLPPSHVVIALNILSPSTTRVERDDGGKKNGTRDEKSIHLHLIPTPRTLEECGVPQLNKRWTDDCLETPLAVEKINPEVIRPASRRKVIHLHEDVWFAKREIVTSRLLARTGRIPRRIFARKTVSKRIDAATATVFLQEHHLWGATRAKYYYGLYYPVSRNDDDSDGGELVAVATFSSRRNVWRGGGSRDSNTSSSISRPFRSHELLRFCSRRDTAVVGGISKLCKKFISEARPDDIVTVIDRDWGDASGWHSLGFETVATMDPIVMAVNPNEPAVRRHLVGAGISSCPKLTTGGNKSDDGGGCDYNGGRMGLPIETLEKLDAARTVREALKDCLGIDGYFPVYDTGVDRLLKVVSQDPQMHQLSARELWKHSKPNYATKYYSPNAGISLLLEYAAAPLSTTLLSDTTDSPRTLDSSSKVDSLASSL